MGLEGVGDAGEDADDGFFDVGVGGEGGGDVDEGDVEGEVGGNEVAVEAVGLAHAAAHLHAVDGMAQFLLGYGD